MNEGPQTSPKPRSGASKQGRQRPPCHTRPRRLGEPETPNLRCSLGCKPCTQSYPLALSKCPEMPKFAPKELRPKGLRLYKGLKVKIGLKIGTCLYPCPVPLTPPDPLHCGTEHCTPDDGGWGRGRVGWGGWGWGLGFGFRA